MEVKDATTIACVACGNTVHKKVSSLYNQSEAIRKLFA
jgi:exosome complex RNA-binding protein Csl4